MFPMCYAERCKSERSAVITLEDTGADHLLDDDKAFCSGTAAYATVQASFGDQYAETYLAWLGTETNSFSPVPIGWQTFEESVLFHGDATQHSPQRFGELLHAWRSVFQLGAPALCASDSFTRDRPAAVRQIQRSFGVQLRVTPESPGSLA